MKKILFASSLLLLALFTSCNSDDDITMDDKDLILEPVDTVALDTTTKVQDDIHAIFNDLLISYVSETGVVDYNGFNTERANLLAYLDTLQANEPQADWSDDRTLAFWINTYNASMINQVLEHNIPSSVLDVKVSNVNNIVIDSMIPETLSIFEIKIAQIGNEIYSLNDIENGIIRGVEGGYEGFNEPRIHFALVCAALSCPKLLNEAYSEDNLDARLQSQAVTFINNTTKNKITSTDLLLSSIFDWFGEDFGDINAYIRQFSNTAFADDDDIKFDDYDWGLNDSELE